MSRTHRLDDADTGVESLKKEAKRWLKLLRAGEAESIARLRRAVPDASTPGVPTLRTVQHALARERGFEGWLALVASSHARQRALRAVADEILRNAIFKGDHKLAARLFERHRGIAKLDLYCAVAAGDLAEVEQRLATDPTAATRPGGPLNWPPILYLLYMRLPGAAIRSVEIARALLDRGADPNSSWNDGWDNAFKCITGAIALGEGVQPTHERANQLVDLLVERGADPVDSQTFYDMSIVDDNTHWLEVLWSHSERTGVTNLWREVSKTRIGGHRNLSPLDFMLSLAVSYRHPRRAEWLLTHGASANSRQAYSGRTLREEALVYGNQSMAALLAGHGASAEPLQGLVAFQVACRNMDREAARCLSEAHPEYLSDAEIMLTAARENRIDIVMLLLDLGVDVDVRNSDEIRALNLAAGFASVELVKLLIERGADVDRPTRHYGGPLGFAGHFGRRDTAAALAPVSRDVHNLVYLGMTERLLELFSAEPTLANVSHLKTGHTPLFTLPEDERVALDMTRFLLERGADPKIRDNDGMTAGEVARKRGQDQVADLLDAAAGRPA